MFELLYSADTPLKTTRLPGLSLLSTVFDRFTARRLPLHMAGDMGHDKTLNTTLKNARLCPYMDELPLHVTPCRRSPSPPKLSLPGPGKSIMSCTEISQSPVRRFASPVESPLEGPQDDDTSGSSSDGSDADTEFEADVEGEDENEDEEGLKYRRSSTYDSQRFEMGVGHRAPLVPSKQLPDLPPIPTEKLSRKFPPLKRVLSRVFLENGADAKSSSSVSIILKAQHDLTHPSTRNDRIPLADSQGSSGSGYDDSSPEVSPSPTTTTFSRLPGVVTITDTFEHPTHTVTRTVIRPSPSHSLFTLPFKRSPSSPGPKSHFWTPEPTAAPDPRSMFEEELEASLQRWEDERKGHNATDIYVVVDRETAHEESWRSLVQEVHHNHRPPSKKLSGECGRW